MRKLSLFLLLLVLVGSLSGCSKPEPQVEIEPIVSAEETTETNEDTSSEYGDKLHSQLIIGISVGEDGYYCLMGDTVADYYEGEMVSIEIDNPALLAFKVSSDRGGGVYIVDKPDGDAMVEDLTALAEELKGLGREDLASKIDEILDILNQSGPITGAST